MELVVKHFDELTTRELWEIYKLRVAVFVVEQVCPYQDVDEHDLVAYHLYLKDEEGIKAYLRVLPPHATFEEASLGRVISIQRRCGLATRLCEEGIKVAQDKFGATELVIHAQSYAHQLYENVGFRQTSKEFLEDDQPHIEMRWYLSEQQ